MGRSNADRQEVRAVRSWRCLQKTAPGVRPVNWPNHPGLNILGKLRLLYFRAAFLYRSLIAFQSNVFQIAAR